MDICTGYDKNSIHQLEKKDNSNGAKYKIYPLTYVQAVYDARNGRRLDTLLDQCNSIYVYWKGSVEQTRLALPMFMRRKGIIITYRNAEDEVITEKNIYDDCIADDVWGLDAYWVRITDALPITGNVTIGSNGNWFVNGEDTGFKAQGPKGENGLPLQPRLSEDKTKIEFTYDGNTWYELFPLTLVTPTIDISETVALEPGATPTVANVGDDFNVNLEFSLPKAPEVNVGSTTTIGEGNQAKVTNSGTKYAPVLNFEIPKGDTGRGINIKGFYPDLPTLQEKVTEPAIGDVYCVGSAEPYEGYVWTNVYSSETQSSTPAWQSLGEINKDTTILVNDLGDREDVAMSQKGVSDQIKNVEKEYTISSANKVIINGPEITILGNSLIISINSNGNIYYIEHLFSEEEQKSFNLSEVSNRALVYNEQTNTIETTQKDYINGRILLALYSTYVNDYIAGALLNSINNYKLEKTIYNIEIHSNYFTTNEVIVQDSTISIIGEELNLFTISDTMIKTINHVFSDEEPKTFDLYSSDKMVLLYDEINDSIQLGDRNSIENKIILAYYVPSAKKIIMGALLNSIQNYNIENITPVYNKNNLNINSENAYQDEIWTWWNYPQLISTVNYNKSFIYGWTDSLGYSGVSQIMTNQNTKLKTTLKKNGVDDHNSCAIYNLNDGRFLVVYTGGHNSDNYLHIRISKSNKQYIKEFEDVINVECEGSTTYCQIFYINNFYYIFSRVSNNKWIYIKSNDAITWSSPHTFITSDVQYYLKLVKVTDKPNILRMCMYSNPSLPDSNIRMGFLDFENNKILQSDGTELGNLDQDSIDKNNFNIIIPSPTEGDNSQRMFDVAESNYNECIIAYCTFKSGDISRSSYYIYETGEIVKILENGKSFLSSYQGGISFIEKDKIVLSHCYENSDHIEIWEKNENWNLVKDVFNESIDQNTRNVRPIVDINKNYIIWQRGYYDEYSYTNFFTNVMAFDIINDKIL